MIEYSEMVEIVDDIVSSLRELAWDAYHFAANPEVPLSDELDPLVAVAKGKIADAVRPSSLGGPYSPRR